MTAGTPALPALKQVFRALATTIEAAESGFRGTLDSESLHDFRVAVRRTRTGLSQVRSVVPAAVVGRFREDFAWLGRATGPARDLDVFLLGLPSYGALMDPASTDGLGPLVALLEARREGELEKLLAVLASKRYGQLIADWWGFLDAADQGGDEGSDAGRPIAGVAAREIRRLWQKVLEQGGRIDPGSRDEKLHRLRVRGKKLRYVLEFFRTLAGASETEAAIGALKTLQDALGDFNDSCVQQRLLTRAAAELTSGNAPAATLVAVDALATLLDRRKNESRALFERRFRRFAGPSSRQIYERLLADLERGWRAADRRRP